MPDMIVSQSNERAGRDRSALKSINGARELASTLNAALPHRLIITGSSQTKAVAQRRRLCVYCVYSMCREGGQITDDIQTIACYVIFVDF